LSYIMMSFTWGTSLTSHGIKIGPFKQKHSMYEKNMYIFLVNI
jgi:hypothetical protein